MKNLGDGPYNHGAIDQIITELFEAGVEETRSTHHKVNIIDPDTGAARMAARGVYIPSAVKEAGTIEVERHRVIGMHHGWEFDRAWYYWRATAITKEAQVMNPDAMDLYNKCGKELRVAGHCGCVPPEPPWLDSKLIIEYLDPNDDGPVMDKLCHIYHNDKIISGPHKLRDVGDHIKRLEASMDVSEAYGGVESYHIDTQEAFNAFCQYLTIRSNYERTP